MVMFDYRKVFISQQFDSFRLPEVKETLVCTGAKETMGPFGWTGRHDGSPLGVGWLDGLLVGRWRQMREKRE